MQTWRSLPLALARDSKVTLVHSTGPALLAGWVRAHGQVLHPEPVSSSGVPWGCPGTELS